MAFSDNSDIMIIRVGVYYGVESRPRYWAGRAMVGVRLIVIA